MEDPFPKSGSLQLSGNRGDDILGDSKELSSNKAASASGLEGEGKLESVSRLIANITHELKTPLHSILSVAGLLAAETDGQLNDEQKRQVALIQRNGTKLLDLITDLLRYSSLQTGDKKAKVEIFDVAKLITDLIESLAPVAAKAGIELQTTLVNLETPFASDKSMLSHILTNLLGNAIKFSPEGGIVTVYAESKSDESLFLQIVDSGIGMTPEVQEAIFRDFFQAEKGDSRRFGGVGLGLSLVKSWVSALGGKIEVKSEKDKGSLFTISLPTRRSVLSAMKILIADKDLSIRVSLEGCFRKDGYQTVVCDELSNLAHLIAEEQPNLVILGMEDNWALLEQLRELNGQPELIILVMSTLDAPEERARSFELGANDFIVKPFDLSELRARVASQLERLNEQDYPSSRRQ